MQFATVLQFNITTALFLTAVKQSGKKKKKKNGNCILHFQNRNVENLLAAELHSEAEVGARSRLHFPTQPASIRDPELLMHADQYTQRSKVGK